MTLTVSLSVTLPPLSDTRTQKLPGAASPVSVLLATAASFETPTEQADPSQVPMLNDSEMSACGENVVSVAVMLPETISENVNKAAPFFSIVPVKFSVVGVMVGASVGRSPTPPTRCRHGRGDQAGRQHRTTDTRNKGTADDVQHDVGSDLSSVVKFPGLAKASARGSRYSGMSPCRFRDSVVPRVGHSAGDSHAK